MHVFFSDFNYHSSITDKKVILDLKLLLNKYRIVNIEMQVLDEGDWPERSVVYLCRCYDNVLKGNEYDTWQFRSLCAKFKTN
ncbi:MAG: hypothetical protein E7298_06160 [Lachnospiraceae bacterium]|nr:hypothetical protein [Lachnospiraceae bacterium]